MNCYLSCDNLSLKVGYQPLINLFSLNLYASQSIALIGSNGCGKTSLLKVLAGLSKPSSGKVHVLSKQLWPENQSEHENFCVFLSHIPGLLLDHNIINNLKFYTQSFGLKLPDESYLNALNRVGLKNREFQTARSLSNGQKRRLTLAALTLIKPNIILADEPTNGLDSDGISLCLNIFEQLMNSNKTALLVATHEQKIIDWCQYKINLENFSLQNKKSKKTIKALL